MAPNQERVVVGEEIASVHPQPSSRSWQTVVPLVYLAAIAPRLLEHAMWRDEAQAWLIARASNSLPQLLANLRYESHPPLWYLVLLPFAHLSADPDWMKLPTFVLAACCAFGIVRIRALARLEQVLFLVSFVMFVGYSTISRSYVLGIALLVAFLLSRERGGPLALRHLLVVLLAMTHFLFAVVGAALWIGLTVHAELFTRARRPTRSVLAAPAGAVGIVTALWLVRRPADSGFGHPPDFGALLHPLLVARTFARSMITAFLATDRETLRSQVGGWASVSIVLLLTGCLLVVAGVAVRRSPWCAGPLAAATLYLLVNPAIVYGSAWWHLGVVPPTVVAMAVIGRTVAPASRTRGDRLQMLALALLLGASTVHTFTWFVSGDARTPYSDAERASEVVRSVCPRACPVVTDTLFRVAAVSAYLGGQPIEAIGSGVTGTFTIWTRPRSGSPVDWDEARRRLRRRGPSAVGVFGELRDPPPDFEVLGAPRRALVDEEFLVVRLRSTHAPGGPQA